MVISVEHVKYSLRNLKKSKSRSFLTIFSIFIGITTLFIFVSFGYGLYNYVNSFSEGSSVDKILVQARGTSGAGLDTTFKLTEKDVRAVKSVPGIEKASGTYYIASEIKQDSTVRYTFLAGYDPNEPLIMDIDDTEVYKGRWLRPGEKNKAMLGYNYQFDDKIMPEAYEIGDSISIDGLEYRVVGFIEEIGNPSDDAAVYITFSAFEENYPSKDSFAMIVGQVDDINKIDSIVDKVEEKLRRSRGQDKGKEDFFVQSFDELIQSFASALNIVIVFIVLIALISVVVSAVNTANTMITSVLERYKEIGILKAIGARNAEIFKIFLFESAFLGFVAGCIGVFFGWIIVYIAEQALKAAGYGFLTPSYSPYLFAGLILFATVTGGISGLFPARNASYTNTVDALRYE